MSSELSIYIHSSQFSYYDAQKEQASFDVPQKVELFEGTSILACSNLSSNLYFYRSIFQ